MRARVCRRRERERRERWNFLSLPLSLLFVRMRANLAITSTSISSSPCKQSIVDTSHCLIVDVGAGLIHRQTFVRERISCRQRTEREKTYWPHLLCLDCTAVQRHQTIYIGDILLSLCLSMDTTDIMNACHIRISIREEEEEKNREREHLHIFPC